MGDRKQCGNNRKIMFLCQIFKIYERIRANKMMKEIKKKLAEELYAFRTGRVTTGLIFGTRQLIEETVNVGKLSVIVFTDYKKI
jgi:hypothetical protein